MPPTTAPKKPTTATTAPVAVERAAHAAIRLRASMSQLTRRLRAAAPGDGPGAARLAVLGQLYRLGALTPTGLAQRERVRLQTLTRVLADLEVGQLIHRRPDPRDARRSLVSITASGVRVLTADVRRREASLADAIASRLSAAERDRLVAACALIDRLGDALERPTAAGRAAVAARGGGVA